jgi:IS5 family transposase
MKCHVDVAAESGCCVRSLETTATNVHDIVKALRLIQEDDEVDYGDAGYLGLEKREEALAGTIHWEKEIERRSLLS